MFTIGFFSTFFLAISQFYNPWRATLIKFTSQYFLGSPSSTVQLRLNMDMNEYTPIEIMFELKKIKWMRTTTAPISFHTIYLFLSPLHTHFIIIIIISYSFFVIVSFSFIFHVLQLSGSNGKEYHFKHRVLQHARTRRSIPHTRVLKREPLVTYWITLIYIIVFMLIENMKYFHTITAAATTTIHLFIHTLNYEVSSCSQ